MHVIRARSGGKQNSISDVFGRESTKSNPSSRQISGIGEAGNTFDSQSVDGNTS